MSVLQYLTFRLWKKLAFSKEIKNLTFQCIVMANLIYLYNLANIDTKDFVIIKNEVVEDDFEVKNSPVSVDDNNFEEFEENDNDSDYVNGFESPAKPKRNSKIENTGSEILLSNFKWHKFSGFDAFSLFGDRWVCL